VTKEIEDAWYFWNHCFYNRVKPSRVVKTRGSQKRDVICHDCGRLVLAKEMRRKVKSFFRGQQKYKIETKSAGSGFVCMDCHNIRQDIMVKIKEDENRGFQEYKTKKFLDSVEKFDELMLDCKFGTCDVLSAHHELLKDDPNRLRTDFLIGLICGERKKKEYLKTLI